MLMVKTVFIAAGMLNQLTMIQNSNRLACKWHAGQKYGKHPYSYHFNMVREYLIKYYENTGMPINSEVIATANLHDILEDTNISKHELLQFGSNVYQDVIRLTKVKPLANYFKQIKESENATIVKFADRICNLSESIKVNDYRMMAKYLKQKKDFAILNGSQFKYFQKDLYWLYFIAEIKLTARNFYSLFR